MQYFNESPKIQSHFLHYVVLIVGLALLGFFLMIFRFNPVYQATTVLAGSIFYSVWGIIHHALEGRLTRLIALEYILFSFLAFVVIFAALFM